MLSNRDHCAIPQIDEVINDLDGYADMLDSVLSEVRRPIGGVPYLLTCRLLQSCEISVARMDEAREGLLSARSFLRPLQKTGRRYRPVDLLRSVLEAMEETSRLAKRHQLDERTPPANLERLALLADCVFLAAQDLQFFLEPTVMLLGRPPHTE
ncbi:hypothetical protein [Modicisalibacter sp. 'Wilcox']|uniref:hypothetical protein n=1 Tax=Modicisalibacter sp. 'Wilcox' TaxID=2679914 RepID=UPI0013D08C65|nr:hypothetical protein [Modicisalibacter sp. 'Wilcox']